MVSVENSVGILYECNMDAVSDDYREDTSPPRVSYPLQDKLKSLAVLEQSLERLGNLDAALDDIGKAQKVMRAENNAQMKQTTVKDFFRG